MKYFWLSMSILCLIASIVFIVRKDFGALPFSIFGTIMNLLNFYMEIKDND